MPPAQLARIVHAATVRDDADLAHEVARVISDAFGLVRYNQSVLQSRVLRKAGRIKADAKPPAPIRADRKTST